MGSGEGSIFFRGRIASRYVRTGSFCVSVSSVHFLSCVVFGGVRSQLDSVDNRSREAIHLCHLLSMEPWAAVPPGPVRVPRQRSLALSVASVTSVANVKGGMSALNSYYVIFIVF